MKNSFLYPKKYPREYWLIHKSNYQRTAVVHTKLLIISKDKKQLSKQI